jgi:hypothetical protein
VRGVVIGIHFGVALDRNVEGEIGLAPYHDLESQVPNNVQQEMDAVVAGLIDDSIATGVNFSSRSS